MGRRKEQAKERTSPTRSSSSAREETPTLATATIMIDNTMGSNNNSGGQDGVGKAESNGQLPQIAVDLSTKLKKWEILPNRTRQD